MNDRIKLAEAMGWTQDSGWWQPPGHKWGDGLSTAEDELPNPFADANDDYAVLEWSREQWKGPTTGLVFKDRVKWHNFKLALTAGPLSWRDGTGYQIGDYARAALEVLK